MDVFKCTSLIMACAVYRIFQSNIKKPAGDKFENKSNRRQWRATIRTASFF
jgi:hypothetical protein